MSKSNMIKYGTIAVVALVTMAVANRAAKKNATVAKLVMG